MNQVFLSLGTNLGQRHHNLEQAIVGLAEHVLITAVSPVYETDPWGVVDQPAFLNACLFGETDCSPSELLSFVKNVEKEMGRTQAIKWGPRLIDIDILLFNDSVYQANGLAIPHPFMHERAFVLAPLADIAADVRHPLLGQTVGELLTAVDSTAVRRLPEPLWVPI